MTKNNNLYSGIIIIAIFILFLSGCPSDSVGDPTPTPDLTIEPSPDPTSDFTPELTSNPTPEPTFEIRADIRADVNRNGTIDLDDPTEDENEDTWDASGGAVMLANLDDDEDAFPTTGSDPELEGYTDAADDVINGEEDLNDLARIKTVPWPEAPAGATAAISINTESQNYIRMFKNTGSNFEYFSLPGDLTLTEIINGVEFGLEAKDIVRDDTVWDGFVTVTYSVSAESNTVQDSVILRVAPVIFLHNLYEVETLAASSFTYQSSIDFRNDLKEALIGSNISNPLYEILNYTDQWTGDFFTSAVMSIPSISGQHFIRLFLRSPNYTSGVLRTAGRVIYTDFRGPDAGTCVQYDPSHPDNMDALNSFGNQLVIPPYSYDGNTWEFGRILRGSESILYPDTSFDMLIQSQGVSTGNTQGFQDIINIETSWLVTGYASEVVNFVNYEEGTHNWAMLVADPLLAWTILQDEYNSSNGDALLFEGKTWSGGAPAAISITAVLSDPDLIAAQNWAIAEIADIVNIIKLETGITDDDIIKVPVLFQDQYTNLAPYTPSLIKGVPLTSSYYAAPDPYGPVIDDVDVFKAQFSGDLAALGITVHYIEDWDLYHRYLGNVLNGTNALRVTTEIPAWWESGL